jgi:hypothetical protein
MGKAASFHTFPAVDIKFSIEVALTENVSMMLQK